MPNTRVRFWPALGGGLAAGFFWAAIGKAFTMLVISSSRLTLVYAGFAVVIAVFVWTYLGWLILLAGAQLAFYLQNPNYLRLGHAVLRLSNNEQERLALDIMARVAQGHRAGDAPWTIEGLGRTLVAAGNRHRRHGRTAGTGGPAGPGRRRQVVPGPGDQCHHAGRNHHHCAHVQHRPRTAPAPVGAGCAAVAG